MLEYAQRLTFYRAVRLELQGTMDLNFYELLSFLMNCFLCFVISWILKMSENIYIEHATVYQKINFNNPRIDLTQVVNFYLRIVKFSLS